MRVYGNITAYAKTKKIRRETAKKRLEPLFKNDRKVGYVDFEGLSEGLSSLASKFYTTRNTNILDKYKD